MRCFISIDIPTELSEKLYEFQKKLRGDLKFVESTHFHICLKYLGEVPDEKVPQIAEVMRQVSSGISPFEISVINTGGFPNSMRPRVVWAGAKANFDFQKVLDAKLAEIGFPPEKREFTPHITLARVRSGKVNMPDLGNIGKFTVTEIRLKKSVLTPKGPIYTTIESALLK